MTSAWIVGTVVALLVAAAIVAFAIRYARHQWETTTLELWTEMDAARVPLSTETYDARELPDLPPPVQRYFRTVLDEGRPVVAAVEITHSGEFKLAEPGGRWVPFRSSQRSVMRRPGFVWDARVPVAPGVKVFVHDAYVAGRGVLHATVLGLATVMEQAPTPELAHGELMRFFAEAAWYPTALLPSQGVRWEEVDESAARATLDDGDTSVTLTFAFDDRGLVERVRSEGRYREVDGEMVAVPWEGRFWNYQRRGGMLVPIEAEVAWSLPEGRAPYWRGTVEEIAFEFAG